jgi:hypothetical protein
MAFGAPLHSGTAICAGVEFGLAASLSIKGSEPEGTSPASGLGRPAGPARAGSTAHQFLPRAAALRRDPGRHSVRLRHALAGAAIDAVSTRTPIPIVEDTATFRR